MENPLKSGRPLAFTAGTLHCIRQTKATKGYKLAHREGMAGKKGADKTDGWELPAVSYPPLNLNLLLMKILDS